MSLDPGVNVESRLHGILRADHQLGVSQETSSQDGNGQLLRVCSKRSQASPIIRK